ncbi:MAG: TonB-dependent receptor plug domain-containing protein [Flammeovirgaceae bacterium]|nr:TonB-dependent receptor plug domain-containing protein [Flammeovirgaceae bacterium]
MKENYIDYLKILIGFCFCLFYSSFVQAQLNSLKSDEMLKLPLKEVMKLDVQDEGDQEIVSASKKAESIFDVPSSATVLTKEEIIKSGATSIPEALRLVPGVIVREVSNGNFDVYLRGMDNILPYGNMTRMISKNTLVMIDNRPVYNYLNGGTFWEMLPIDINDLERIEVVRGAVASLYGPNAASGVIHLITKKKDNENVDVNANFQYGSFNSIIANTSVGYRANEKFSAIFSTNFQNRGRTDDQYFSVDSVAYVDYQGLNLSTSELAYILPNEKTATNQFGINTFINYSPSARVSFDLRAGLQNSEGHRVFEENGTTILQYRYSSSNYIDFEANTYGIKTQVSKYSGTVKARASTAYYDFDITDAYTEYNYEGVKNLRLSPILAYRKVIYDDSQHLEEGANHFQFIQGKQSIGSIGAGIKADYQLNKKFRFIGAIRGEKYEIQDKIYLNYNFATTFKRSPP